MVTYRKISNAFHRTLGDIPSFEIQDGPNFTNFIEHTLSVRFIHHVVAINLVVLSFLLEHSRHPLSLESPPGGEAGSPTTFPLGPHPAATATSLARWRLAPPPAGRRPPTKMDGKVVAKNRWLTLMLCQRCFRVVFHGCFYVFFSSFPSTL